MRYPNGHEFEYRLLRPSQIRVDPLYQRDLDTKRVDKIVKEFSGTQFNEPKVSYRDGVYWVFDGQHSVAAWRQYHGCDKLVNCKVFKGMTWLDECIAFVKQNGIQKDPTTNEKLKAAYNSGNPDVVDMKTKAELCGFTVDFSLSKSATRIVATSALFGAYKSLTPEAYLDMLTAIKEAWYGDPDAVSKSILSGMTVFYKKYYGNFKNDELVKSLKRVSPSVIIRNGRPFKKVSAYSLEILKVYNARRSKWRLENLL